MLLALSLLACGDKDTDDNSTPTEETGLERDSDPGRDTAAEDSGGLCELVDFSPKTIPADMDSTVTVMLMCDDGEAQETIELNVGYSSDILSKEVRGVEVPIRIHHHASTLERQHKPLVFTKAIDASTAHMVGESVFAMSQDHTAVYELNKVPGAPIGEIAIDSIFTPIRNVSGGFLLGNGDSLSDGTVDGSLAEHIKVFESARLWAKVSDVRILDAWPGETGLTVVGTATSDGADQVWVVQPDGSYTTFEALGEISAASFVAEKAKLLLSHNTNEKVKGEAHLRTLQVKGEGTLVTDFDLAGSSHAFTPFTAEGAVVLGETDRTNTGYAWDFDGHGQFDDANEALVDGEPGVIILDSDSTTTIHGTVTSTSGDLLMQSCGVTGPDGAFPISDPWTVPEQAHLVAGSEPPMWATASTFGSLLQEGDEHLVATDGESEVRYVVGEGGAEVQLDGNKQYRLKTPCDHPAYSSYGGCVAVNKHRQVGPDQDGVLPFLDEEGQLYLLDAEHTGEGNMADYLRRIDQFRSDFNVVIFDTDSSGGWTGTGVLEEQAVTCSLSVEGDLDCQEVETGGTPLLTATGDFYGTDESDLLFLREGGTTIVAKSGDGETVDTLLLGYDIEYYRSVSVADLNGDGLDDVVVHEGPESWLLLADGDGGWLDEEHSMELYGLHFPGLHRGARQKGDLRENSHYADAKQ